MKRILLIVAFCNFTYFFSQCTISGADQIQVGEKQIYAAASSENCSGDCYQWSYLDQKILLETDERHREITIKGSVPGQAILNLEINAPSGRLTCQKSITVIAPLSDDLNVNRQKCDINIDGFKEVRTSDQLVMFSPQTSETKLTFEWKVIYKDGDAKKSTQQNPQFEYSLQRAISQVELNVSLEGCTKRIIKNYDTNFWYFF